MTRPRRICAIVLLSVLMAAGMSGEVMATPLNSALPSDSTGLVRTALLLGLMAFIPSIVICMTSFVRIVIVLSMIRHALGMPETPPNSVLVSLALFLTALSMGPTLQRVADSGVQPFLAGSISVEQGMERASAPLREFMLKQVRDKDLKTVYAIAKQPLPASASQVGLMQLTPAFMLNELRFCCRWGC
jgi:flagellar biosynthesis protein FliP